MDEPSGNSSCHRGTRNLDSRTAAEFAQRFGEVITTESDLRKIVGPANRWFTSKILNKLDRRCQDFIAASDDSDMIYATTPEAQCRRADIARSVTENQICVCQKPQIRL